MEEESFESTDSSLTKNSLLPELLSTHLMLITRGTKLKMDYEININNSMCFRTVQNLMFVQDCQQSILKKST